MDKEILDDGVDRNSNNGYVLFAMVLHSSILLGCFAKTLIQIRHKTHDHVQLVVDFNISRK
jgi:hypothetical protein